MYRNLSEFYHSTEWEQFRALILQERTGPDGVLRCEYSGEPILKRYDAIVHHIIELTEENVFDAEIALNPNNVMVVSFRSHNKIHERFGGYQRRVYLVYGSPCSGKTSWVNENARPDDLILDVDRIWDAVCNDGRYNKVRTKSSRPGRLLPNIFGIRDCILDQIKTRTGKWRTAFVIGGYPLRSERDRLCMLLNAEPIFIEATKEECLERCAKERPSEWIEYIENWFDNFMQ